MTRRGFWGLEAVVPGLSSPCSSLPHHLTCLSPPLPSPTHCLDVPSPAIPFPLPAPHLAVQTQEDEHHEEQGGPQWGEGHHSDSLGVGDESQSRAWRGGREVTLSVSICRDVVVQATGPRSHSDLLSLPCRQCCVNMDLQKSMPWCRGPGKVKVQARNV